MHTPECGLSCLPKRSPFFSALAIQRTLSGCRLAPKFTHPPKSPSAICPLCLAQANSTSLMTHRHDSMQLILLCEQSWHHSILSKANSVYFSPYLNTKQRLQWSYGLCSEYGNRREFMPPLLYTKKDLAEKHGEPALNHFTRVTIYQ